MQALILAAGMGKRLGEHTKDKTKCMVEVNHKTLIEHALDALNNTNLSKVIIVIGHAGQRLKEHIGTEYKRLNIVYVENAVYSKTNNIYSLWLAKEYLQEDDTIILESDLIFDKKILQQLISNPNPNMAVVAKYESWMNGTVTILDERDNIANFVSYKDFKWDNAQNYYKTVNIYKFSKDFASKFYIPFLDAYITTFGNKEYYEQVLKVITYLANTELKALKVQHEKWYEIDDVQDLDIAELLFAGDEEKLALFQNRYGGYWRFDNLKDFCYLVNPFFPSAELLNEIKSNFDVLISQYPSGLNVQNLLAAKMFHCVAESIVVGNGAAELIRILMNVLTGKIGAICPTFNEYPKAIGAQRVKTFVPKNADYHYTVSELRDFAHDVNALVLINPDNPSGHFLPKHELLELLEALHRREIFLIVDESFLDFAEEADKGTLIEAGSLRAYKNLIVIKSISKSYGVPGLRLGVLVSGNTDIIAQVREQVPIWNINSFAEYFLQIFSKYETDYLNACKQICTERKRFYDQLKNMPYLRPIPSHANFFLCEVVSKFTATQLTRVLLREYDILIKDCTGKNGFENKEYVRIALKNAADNDYLTAKLQELAVGI